MAQDKAGQGNKTRRNTKNKQPNRKAKRNKTRQEPKTKRAERTSIQDSTKSNHTSHHAELTQGMPNPDETQQRTQLKKAASVTRASLQQTSEDQQEEPTQDSSHHTKLRSGEANRVAQRNCDSTKLSQDMAPNKTRRKVRKQSDESQAHL